MQESDADQGKKKFVEDFEAEQPQASPSTTAPDVREKLAEYAHEAWAGWMRYLFQFGTLNNDGTFTINADKVERWQRQMNTPYPMLPEREKDSDRIEADSILAITTAT